jgi:hypothetical protein
MSGPKVGVGVFVVSDNCVLVGKRCDLFLAFLHLLISTSGFDHIFNAVRVSWATARMRFLGVN